MKAHSPEHLGILSKRQLRSLLNHATWGQRKAALEAIRLSRIMEEVKFELEAREKK